MHRRRAGLAAERDRPLGMPDKADDTVSDTDWARASLERTEAAEEAEEAVEAPGMLVADNRDMESVVVPDRADWVSDRRRYSRLSCIV